jgi:hypothetical protein
MRYDPRKQVRRTLWGIFLGTIILYAIFQMRDIIFGARLTVNTITDGEVVAEQLITISGNMRHASSVIINGNVVATNQNGDFTDELLLSPGYNLITIDVRDRFGKLIEKTYRVLYNEETLAEPSQVN